MKRYYNPNPYYLTQSSLEEFILGMLSLGKPIETAIVGAFDTEGRGSRRDIDLPLHRDGEYSQKMVEAQGGTIVTRPGIDIVGLYCIREGVGECLTLVEDQEFNLKKGQALVFDNKKVRHGRRGQVGERLLLRMWIGRSPDGEAQSS